MPDQRNCRTICQRRARGWTEDAAALGVIGLDATYLNWRGRGSRGVTPYFCKLLFAKRDYDSVETCSLVALKLLLATGFVEMTAVRMPKDNGKAHDYNDSPQQKEDCKHDTFFLERLHIGVN